MDEPEWIIEQAKARKRRELLRQREEMEARLAKIRAAEKSRREKYLKGRPHSKRRKIEEKEKAGDGDHEEQFALDDYDSDREGEAAMAKGDVRNGLSAETLALLEKLGMNLGPLKDEEEEFEDETKVFRLCYVVHSILKS